MELRAGRFALPALGLLALLCAFGSPGFASQATPVDVEMRVAYVTKEKGAIDPDCVELMRRLPMEFGSCQIKQSERFQLDLGDPAQFELPTGRAVRVLPVSLVGPYLHVQFEISGVLNTRLQMVSGRPMIVGGERHGNGQLIVELTPSFDALEGPPAPSRARPSSGPHLQQVGGSGR